MNIHESEQRPVLTVQAEDRAMPGTGVAENNGSMANAATDNGSEALSRILAARPLVLSQKLAEYIATHTGDTTPPRDQQAEPTTQVFLESDRSPVTPLSSPISTEAVLVDRITTKVETGKGFKEVTTTRDERHQFQLDAAVRRMRELKAYYKLSHRKGLAEGTQTSSTDGLPSLQDGQRYARVSVDGYQPQENPLSHLVVRRGNDSADGTRKVRYISGRHNASMVRGRSFRR